MEEEPGTVMGTINRNVLLSVIHVYVRRCLSDLPEWTEANSERIRESVSVSAPTLAQMLSSDLALSPYSPRVGFAWCNKKLQIFARVKHSEEWDPDGTEFREAKKIRYKLNRNVLRNTVAMFLRERLAEMPQWLSEHPRAVAGWIRREPDEIRALSRYPVEIGMRQHEIIVRWADRTIEMNILVHNS